MTLALKIPPLLLTALVAIAMVCSAEPIHSNVNIAVAIALWIGAIMVVLLAVTRFRQHQTTVNPYALDGVAALVDSGIFRFSRNPMYLAMAMGLLGISVLQGSLLTLLYVAGFILYLTQFQIKPEERFLQQKFGDAYTQYCQQVRRWV